MKLKLVANLLVTIHNLATAEALLLAQRSGLDLSMVYDAIAGGGPRHPGCSRCGRP
jgi:L-threonate 2-dehydrogenase